ncbi:MAG: pyridoxamine 5'-phosphate oxidase [Verrucomicrobiota bacterium]
MPTGPEHGATGLDARDLSPDPIQQFQSWFDLVLRSNLPEPNAMTLATSTSEGVPSARIVLLKAVDARGFVFFTNYESQKGQELATNPHVALVFFWPTLARQVRVIGTATQVSREESDHYFHSRPVGSQLGAWASRQSQVLPDRAELDRAVAQLELQYKDSVVPLPPYWGGYRVDPTRIEFWQARLNRLHDRFRYTRLPTGHWHIERLSP